MMSIKHKCYAKKSFIGLTALLSFLAIGITGTSQAGGVKHYGIQDWVAAQGSYYDVDGDGTWEPSGTWEGGDLYVPPANNYIGWIAPANNFFGSVDYAGIAAKYLKKECNVDLGTAINGSVTTRDGVLVTDSEGNEQVKVLVSVQLKAKNALAWGGIFNLDLDGDGDVDRVGDDDPDDIDDWDFARQSLQFGARVADVCDGIKPSLANVEANIEYYVNVGDNPLVDIGTFNYEFRKLMFRSSATGTFVDGTPARMTIVQTGIFMPNSQSPKYDGFPVEFIKFQTIGR